MCTRLTRGCLAQPGRLTGRCIKYNPQKGYGFIQPSDGSDDVFVHNKCIKAQGFRCLQYG